jgi:hypothetical protein
VGGGYHAFQGDKWPEAKVTEDWGGKSESLSSSLWFHLGGSGYPLVEARKERFPGEMSSCITIFPLQSADYKRSSLSKLKMSTHECLSGHHQKLFGRIPLSLNILKREYRTSSSMQTLQPIHYLCSIFRACHTGVFCLVGGPIKEIHHQKKKMSWLYPQLTLT